MAMTHPLATLTCCVDDPLSWCPACDRTVSEPLMVWADVDLFLCFECAGVKRPWHDWGSDEMVRY